MLKVTSQLLTDKTREAQHHVLPPHIHTPPPVPLVITDHSDPEWRGGENYGTHSLPSSCLPRAPAGKSGTPGQAMRCHSLPSSIQIRTWGTSQSPPGTREQGGGKALNADRVVSHGSHPQLSPAARAGKAFFPQPALQRHPSPWEKEPQG